MGYWDETCAITGLPIKEGERVLMLVPSDERGTWREPTQWSFITRNVTFIGTGTYDGYGGIDERPGMDDLYDRQDQRSIFVRLDVWERVRELMEPIMMRELDGDDDGIIGKDRLPGWRDVITLTMFCMRARIDPHRGMMFKGCQHDELAPYRELSDILNDAIRGTTPSIMEMSDHETDRGPV